MTIAVTSKGSPTAAFAAYLPPSSWGVTSRIGIRPTMSPNLPRPLGPEPRGSAAREGCPSRRGTVPEVTAICASAGLWNDPFRYPPAVRAIRRFTVRPVLPSPLHALGELVGNLRWSWHPPTQDLFASVDPQLWDASGHDPVKLLGRVQPARLAQLAKDRDFLDRLAGARADLATSPPEARWYQTLGDEAPAAIGYFSPEFGITAVLPQYSGGLGILAGDHLKAASDLGVPIVGVGLLYKHGYFKQSLSSEGWQQETYPVLDPDELPLSLLREADGTRASVTIEMPGGPDLVARIWVASVGRVPLLLLDSDVEGNPDHYREVTDRLYGGTKEHR